MRAVLLVGLMVVSLPLSASDALVLSWTPPDSARVGRSYRANETVMVPAGNVARLAIGDEILTLHGYTEFRVPQSKRPDVITALAAAMRTFSQIFHLRSGESGDARSDLWAVDTKKSGPHCLWESGPPQLAGGTAGDYEVRLQSRALSAFVRVPAGSRATWPATLPYEVGTRYLIRDVRDNSTVERSFVQLPQKPATDADAVAVLLNAGCISQGGLALARLPHRNVGPE